MTWIDWYAAPYAGGYISTTHLSRAGGRLRFPLLVALARGHTTVVERLLPYVNSADKDAIGCTVLEYLARWKGGEGVLARLCDRNDEARSLLALMRDGSGEARSLRDRIEEVVEDWPTEQGAR